MSSTAAIEPQAASVGLTPAAATTRAAIIEAAERLFRSLGYQKTTVADIARELRMSPANVYRFFPSKSAINEAICQRLLRGLDRQLHAVAHGPGTPPERIHALFRLLQEQTVALFFHERRMHDMVAAALEEHWPVIDEHVEALRAALRHVVEEGAGQGVFASGDAAQSAKLMHCCSLLFIHPAMVEQCQDHDNLAEMADAMAGFCLRALRPDCP